MEELDECRGAGEVVGALGGFNSGELVVMGLLQVVRLVLRVLQLLLVLRVLQLLQVLRVLRVLC